MVDNIANFLTAPLSGSQQASGAANSGKLASKLGAFTSGNSDALRQAGTSNEAINSPSSFLSALLDSQAEKVKGTPAIAGAAQNTDVAGSGFLPLNADALGANDLDNIADAFRSFLTQNTSDNIFGDASGEALSSLQDQQGDFGFGLTNAGLLNSTLLTGQATEITNASGIAQSDQSGDALGGFQDLLGHINDLLQQPNLENTNPALFSQLNQFQNITNQAIADGGQNAGDLRSLLGGLNSLLALSPGAPQIRFGLDANGGLATNKNNLTSGLLNAQQGAVQAITSGEGQANAANQLGPDALPLLNSRQFAGFSAQGRAFGAFANGLQNNVGGGLNDLASGLNGLEPGSAGSTSNNGPLSTQSLLQLLNSATQNGALGSGSFGNDAGQSLFGGDQSFGNTTLTDIENQQNAILANANAPGLQAGISTAVQAPQAGSPHPANQVIATHIARTAGANKAQQLTLQLSPAELGRVHVSLELSRDNTLKARITTERADTFDLLQRDSNSLQKALADAGVDLSGDNLTYDLADGEDNFNAFLDDQAGSQSGRDNLNGRQPDQQADDDVIETTLNLNIDPATGHVRYNILA